MFTVAMKQQDNNNHSLQLRYLDNKIEIFRKKNKIEIITRGISSIILAK